MWQFLYLILIHVFPMVNLNFNVNKQILSSIIFVYMPILFKYIKICTTQQYVLMHLFREKTCVPNPNQTHTMTHKIHSMHNVAYHDTYQMHADTRVVMHTSFLPKGQVLVQYWYVSGMYYEIICQY